MEMGLHGPDWPTRGLGDLGKRALAEESEGDDLAIGFLEPCDRGAELRITLADDRRGRRIAWARQVDRRHLSDDRSLPGHRFGTAAERVETDDRTSTGRLTKRDPHGNPGQPCTEWAFATPRAQRAKCRHEGLLGGIFGLVEIAENAIARSDHDRRLAFDQSAIRLPITIEDRPDDGVRLPIGDRQLGSGSAVDPLDRWTSSRVSVHSRRGTCRATS
jgi:hypothetical protein